MTDELKQFKNEVIKHFDERTVRVEKRFDEKTTEMKKYLDETTKETKRHFDVVAKGLKYEIQKPDLNQLQRFLTKFSPKKAILVSKNTFQPNQNGISILPLWLFLLQYNT